jgi:hypothetical protein
VKNKIVRNYLTIFKAVRGEKMLVKELYSEKTTIPIISPELFQVPIGTDAKYKMCTPKLI